MLIIGENRIETTEILDSKLRNYSILALAVILGVTFQVGHFIEHAIQFGVWLAGYHTTPYMSPIAMWLTHKIGSLLFATADMPRQMMMGMEILHLIGNSIFLLTIAGLYHYFPVKLVRYALYVEAFHLCEHISLTLTGLYLNKASGISTFFGFAESLGGHEFAVGYRVIWHFGMNLVPSGLIMMALMRRRPR